MPRQYLLPGVGYVNEDDAVRKFLMPPAVYIDESSVNVRVTILTQAVNRANTY